MTMTGIRLAAIYDVYTIEYPVFCPCSIVMYDICEYVSERLVTVVRKYSLSPIFPNDPSLRTELNAPHDITTNVPIVTVP